MSQSFQFSAKQFISLSAQEHNIVRMILEEVMNLGGTLEDFLAVQNDDRKLAVEFAWSLTRRIRQDFEKPIALDVDWDSDNIDFIKKLGKRVYIYSGVLFYSEYVQRFRDFRPDTPCMYRLVQIGKGCHSPLDVYDRYQHAGFRELCTFLRTVQVPPEFAITALESFNLATEHGKPTPQSSFVASTIIDGQPTVSFASDIFSKPFWFCLVREPLKA